MARQNGITLSFLPLYYLTALSIGYYSGFFLLLFGPEALERTRRRFAARRLLCHVVPVLVYMLAGLTPVGLLLENVPAIRASNAPHLDRYARLAAGSLPPEGAVVISDDSTRLWVLQAALARDGKAGRYLPVETRNLFLAAYREWLSRKYPGRWPQPKDETKPAAAGPTVASLDSAGQIKLMFNLMESNRVYCLQSGVGLLLDQLNLQPRGLLHEVKFYAPDSLSEPPLPSVALAENQAFWQSAIETGVKPLLGLISQAELPRSAFEGRLMESAHLQTPPPAQARVLGQWYSGALNRWGVTLQRNGRWSEATPCFALAQELNPENLPAHINLQCNSNLLAHHKMTVDRTMSLPDQFSRGRGVALVLTEDGPFDDPSYCYCLGQAFASDGMRWQACQQFERLAALVPGDIYARLALGDLYTRGGRANLALQIATDIRASFDLQPLDPTSKVKVSLLEARAWLSVTNLPTAQGIISALLATHRGDASVLQGALAALTDYQCYSDAFRIIDRQLQFNPKDTIALVNKGNLCVLTGVPSNAIPPLTLALSLTNSLVARYLRALAYSRTGSLDAAEADYQEILRASPNAYPAYARLSEIAERRKDTQAAVRYCEQYLSGARADTEEARTVAARLKSLQQAQH
jgi:tetratricopeptide (TPR) repeat protein